MSYDPLGPDVLADPFPSYAELREHCPVHHFDRFTPPFFTLSRYDDVIEALRDVETWSMRYGPSPQYTRPSGLVNDPPEHTEFRRLFHRGFTPRTVGGLEEEITALAVELLDAMAPLGRGDFHEHYAVRLPITVIARMLGVPEADHVLFKDMTFEEWRNTMSITLDGSFHCIKACLQSMLANRSGNIITLGGDAVLLGGNRKAHNTTAKNGLIGLTRALAKELAEDRIRVNCVSPGSINATRPAHRSTRSDVKLTIPLGRRGESEEIAAVVRFLCGPGGGFITGQTIHASGGDFIFA